jgi:hypothetical protein
MDEHKGTFSGVKVFENMDYVRSVVGEICRTTPPPYRSVDWAVIPDPEGDPCLMLVLFLENFAEHSESQQTSIGEWAGVLITKIRAAGIPCYLMRVSKNDL